MSPAAPEGSVPLALPPSPPASPSATSLPVPAEFFNKSATQPLIRSQTALQAYHEVYERSIKDGDNFWAEQARHYISWDRDFETVHEGSFEDGDNAWFTEGRLNASFNCVDRHAKKKPTAPALIYEPDDPNEPGRTLSWKELQREVCRLSWVLKRDFGVQKGDTVAIYMPMVPEAFIAVLACTRVGAIHSVVFGGFSPNALRDRIQDASAKVVLTADEGIRGGKTIHLKNLVDEALTQCPGVANCLVYRRTGNSSVPMTAGRDSWWDVETQKWPAVYAPESMNAEDPLFMLYTSGSTGKPKGLMHTTAGYLLGAALSTQYVFDIHPDNNDVFFCGADIGWITGHTYSLYGPLMLGCTVVIYEGQPVHPTPSRYWEIIAKHRVTQLYSAPTVLRLLKRAGDEYVKTDGLLSHLRVIGSVGEPLAANVWQWVHDVVGKGSVHVVDTFFQTETGSYLIAPLAGTTPIKPGCCTLPFFGVEPALLDPVTGVEITTAGVEGVLTIKRPIPSMSRTVWRDHQRFMNVYYNPYPGYYFTGDGAIRDKDGYFWIQGRVDDVINVAAHRLSTAEIEAALLEHPIMAEVAVVGVPDDLTGQAVAAFVSLKESLGATATTEVAKKQVNTSIGKFASPKHVILVQDLPKNRAGKIMRRLLRKIWCGEEDQLGDITTLVNPASINDIIDIVKAGRQPAIANAAYKQPVLQTTDVEAVEAASTTLSPDDVAEATAEELATEAPVTGNSVADLQAANLQAASTPVTDTATMITLEVVPESAIAIESALQAEERSVLQVATQPPEDDSDSALTPLEEPAGFVEVLEVAERPAAAEAVAKKVDVVTNVTELSVAAVIA